MRSTLDPLLPTAARDAIQVIDADAEVSGTLKKSVRRLLVDQREFSSTFFSAVEREIDSAVDDLFRSDRDERRAKEKAGAPAAAALSLVDYDQMEENMLLDKFAARIRNAADEHFRPLTQRLASALGVPGPDRSRESISSDPFLQGARRSGREARLQGRPETGCRQGVRWRPADSR